MYPIVVLNILNVVCDFSKDQVPVDPDQLYSTLRSILNQVKVSETQ